MPRPHVHLTDAYAAAASIVALRDGRRAYDQGRLPDERDLLAVAAHVTTLRDADLLELMAGTFDVLFGARDRADALLDLFLKRLEEADVKLAQIAPYVGRTSKQAAADFRDTLARQVAAHPGNARRREIQEAAEARTVAVVPEGLPEVAAAILDLYGQEPRLFPRGSWDALDNLNEAVGAGDAGRLRGAMLLAAIALEDSPPQTEELRALIARGAQLVDPRNF